MVINDNTKRLEHRHWDASPENRQYIPHATTYLNQGRWTDEIAPRDGKLSPQALVDRTNDQIERLEKGGIL